jgi:neutral ceramidase
MGRGIRGAWVLVAAMVLLAACEPAEGYGRDPGTDDAVRPDLPMPDAGTDPAGDDDREVSPGDLALADEGPDGAADGVAPDVAVPPEPAWVPPDAALRAAFATRDLPVPLGISTGGYGQMPPAGSPTGPFNDGFQATTTQLQPPRVQVLHVLRDGRRLLLVQADLIAILRPLYLRVVDRVRERTGVDVSEVLVMAGTHSHTAPARIFDTALGPFFSDTYEEQVFQRVAEAFADAIVDALGQAAVPVRFGQATTQNAAMHLDRRCENGDLRDDTMHLLRFDRADGGGTLALVVNYALHGTVFGWEAGVLGGDAPRAVEMKVREALDGAPPVMFFQSWSGDVGPADPRGDFPDAAGPEAPLPALDRLEAIGRSGAETVRAAWDTFQWEDAPDLVVASALAPMTTEAVGYAAGEWDHPAGAMLCGGGGSVCTAVPPAMESCLDLDFGMVPDTVRLTAFRLGTVAGVTLPGEPHTALAQELLPRVMGAVRPAWKHLLFGYAQDHVGYLMTPADWAGGGYEPGMAFFGPGAGRYLSDAVASLAARLSNPAAPLSFVPAAVPAWVPGASRPYAPARSLVRGTVVTDLPAGAAAGDLLTFRWTGGDPWVDRPEVTLQRDAGDGTFEVVRSGGVPVDQRGYRVLLQVAPDPAWSAAAPGGRTFTWTATVRTAVRMPAPEPGSLEGRLRLAVSGRALDADGHEAGYAILSGASAVGAAP